MIGGLAGSTFENKFVAIKPAEPYIQKAIPTQHVFAADVPAPVLPAPVVPVPIETSLTREQLAQMEASIITIRNLNRIPLYSTAHQMFEKFFESLPIETIKENINFLASYGIIPPLEDGAMSGGVRSQRVSRPSIHKKENIEYMQDIKNTATLAKEARDIAAKQAAENERIRLYNIDWHTKNPSGFIPSNYTPATLPQIYVEAVEKLDKNHSASALFEAIMPPIVVEKWKFELEHNCRDVYEPSGPETQCNNTIGEFKNQACYICGFDILPEQGPPAFFYRTCEHILPIIQAVFFLDLYRGSEKNTITPEQLSLLKLEYSWAHQSCNMVKSDDSYLCTVLDGKFPTWVYSEKNIRQILTNIYNTDSYNPGSNIVQYKIREYESKIEPYKTGYAGWLDDRVRYIIDKKMKPIQSHLNKSCQPGLLMMIGLGNLMNTSKWSELFSQTYREVMSAPTPSEETIPTTPYQEIARSESPPPLQLSKVKQTRRNVPRKPSIKFRKNTIKNRKNK